MNVVQARHSDIQHHSHVHLNGVCLAVAWLPVSHVFRVSTLIERPLLILLRSQFIWRTSRHAFENAVVNDCFMTQDFVLSTLLSLSLKMLTLQ